MENLPVVTVTELNRQVRNWLEHEIGPVCVTGEISNLTKPASGHLYFSLKDAHAQVRCVYFRNRRAFNDSIQNGQQVLASGTLSLYEPRGDYQLIVDTIQEAGQGDLYRQFELLKVKLAALGLFESSRKRPIPRFPTTIGIITSSTAAALRDIVTTLARRYPLANLLIYPSEVQGKQAPLQLINAIVKANQENRCDVLIVARGGGSIEDLWAFNDEMLAHAIVKSAIPIVTGVGHETDFTIADFAADLRAATPTAAAEAVSPNLVELVAQLQTLEERVLGAMTRYWQHHKLRLDHAMQKIASPTLLINKYWQMLDYLKSHLNHAVNQQWTEKRHELQVLLARLHAKSPALLVQQEKSQVLRLQQQLTQHTRFLLERFRQQLVGLLATLHAVSPLATLSRGYSITTSQQHVISNSEQLVIGDVINTRLAYGSVTSSVLRIKHD